MRLPLEKTLFTATVCYSVHIFWTLLHGKTTLFIVYDNYSIFYFFSGVPSFSFSQYCFKFIQDKSNSKFIEKITLLSARRASTISYVSWSLSWENLSSGFAIRWDSNRPTQLQKLARGLTFHIQKLEILYYLGSKQQRCWSDSRMCRLICAFLVLIWHKQVFSRCDSVERQFIVWQYAWNKFFLRDGVQGVPSSEPS